MSNNHITIYYTQLKEQYFIPTVSISINQPNQNYLSLILYYIILVIFNFILYTFHSIFSLKLIYPI